MYNKNYFYPEEGFSNLHGLKSVDKKSGIYTGMNALQQFGVDKAFEIIDLGLMNKFLAPIHYGGRILDFGCGTGGSTYFFHLQGADVTAVDLSNHTLGELRRLNFLSDENIILGDGIELMNNAPEGTYDTVAAFMLGPGDEKFTINFHEAANHAINDNGRIIAFSECYTISSLKKNLTKGYFYEIPNGIIIRKCKKL